MMGSNPWKTRDATYPNDQPDNRVSTRTVPENQRADRLDRYLEMNAEEKPKDGTGRYSKSFTQETNTSARENAMSRGGEAGNRCRGSEP